MQGRPWSRVALALVLALATPGDGQHPNTPEASPPVPAADTSAGLQWTEGWEAGRAKARERKQLMLVYVPHHKQSEELTREFEEKIFRDPRHPEIASRCAPVRVQVGSTPTPEVKEFLRRFEVQAFPGLFVMNADGHFLVGSMRCSVDSVLRSLTWAEDSEKKFALLSEKTDPVDRAEYRRQSSCATHGRK